MKHTIKVSDFEGYEADHIFASSFGKGTNKRLAIITELPDCKSYFRVSSHKVRVLDTSSFAEAVDKYNELD